MLDHMFAGFRLVYLELMCLGKRDGQLREFLTPSVSWPLEVNQQDSAGTKSSNQTTFNMMD